MGHYYHILLKSPLYEQTICNWVVLTWNCEFFNASATLPSLPSVQTDSLLNYYPPTTISSCASTVGYKICLAAGTAWCSLSKLNVSPEEHEKLLINMQNEYVSGGLAAIISCVDQRRQHVIYSRLRQQRGEDAFTLWSYFNTHTPFHFQRALKKNKKKKHQATSCWPPGDLVYCHGPVATRKVSFGASFPQTVVLLPPFQNK